MRYRALGPRLFVRLYKVDQTEHLWVFTFRDPINHFMQSAIIAKDSPWEAMANIWEKIHVDWTNELNERANTLYIED